MRVTSGSVAAVVLAVVACAGCGQGAGTAEAADGEAQADLVQAVGCPTSPEPGCVTIAAGGESYDITAAGVDMSRGVGISIAGRPVGEVTSCGVKLTEVKVNYLGLQCAPPPEAPAA